MEVEGMHEKPTVSALAPWYGSNRMLGHRVGELLKGCKWVGVPFAGGMAELVHIDGGRKQSNGSAPEVLLVKRQGGAA